METEFEKEKRTRNHVTCNANDIWSVLGKTWALLILKKLSENQSTRFNEIKKAIPMISNTVLSERLRDLEVHSLITRKVYAEVPLRVEYSITKQTHELGNILKQLDNWILRWRSEKPKK
ncbi:MAG: helix-turn-helix transcriptional regulator [Nitrosopumilus sp.]|nr:helix-turn-helix transcriptional regulator [Nitrosopumilus sp.]MDH3515824.1 helix-turn-helix transcriptional regulator [Nitrosopumilus sp.]MDH5416698.1 helix-turn-helix transcriptional regulator [Nitrosopumilus sp.]MDH5554432.1 helix-turn-helix transcriptional regulator [Nitrosopumilus sp.]